MLRFVHALPAAALLVRVLLFRAYLPVLYACWLCHRGFHGFDALFARHSCLHFTRLPHSTFSAPPAAFVRLDVITPRSLWFLCSSVVPARYIVWRFLLLRMLGSVPCLLTMDNFVWVSLLVLLGSGSNGTFCSAVLTTACGLNRLRSATVPVVTLGWFFAPTCLLQHLPVLPHHVAPELRRVACLLALFCHCRCTTCVCHC